MGEGIIGYVVNSLNLFVMVYLNVFRYAYFFAVKEKSCIFAARLKTRNFIL